MVAFWNRLRTRDEARENNGIHLEEITPPVDDVLLKALLGSETIDRKKALTLPAVAGAVDFISNAVACMPVKLYKEKQGKVEEVKGDGRTKLLNGDTGDSLDAFQLKKAMVTDYLMGKGGYCYIRKYRNEVTGLFYVKDEFISFEWTKAPIINKDYQVIVDGRLYRPYEFIKILRNTVDGASGVGLTEEISKELETAYQTLLYQLGMVKTGGNKRGFLRAERKLGAEEIDALKQAWRNMYGNNTESVVVLNNGLQFQEASNSSVEMQMNESKRTLTDEIYDLFHIYPNDFDRTFKEAIYPIVKAFETALNRDLLLEKEKKNHYFEFDVKEIIRASLTERYSAYKTAKETGFLTINEIRRAENLNWIEGLDVVNVGLGAVLYDVEKQKFFTPNTGEATDIESATQAGEDQKTQDMIISHEEAEAFDESGNSAERELRFNDTHDPKTGRFAPKGLAGMATSQSWEEFKNGMYDSDIRDMMVQNGIKSPKALRDYWVQQRRGSFTGDDVKELSQEEAVQIIRDKIPENIRNGWFVNADSRYKEPIESIILENKEVRNAGLNIAYYNAKDGGSDQDFRSFVNSEQTMYRGDRGQSAIDADVFMSYSLDKKVAQGFGGSVAETKLKPIDTYGSYQTTGEQEVLVPRDILDKRELRFNENHDPKTGRFSTGDGGGLKQAQFDIIQKTNPMRDDYHVGIRKVEDIKTAREAFETDVDEDEDYVYPDFSQADGMKALETGKITIYSSKPIQNGGFVATSKMMAQDYAGGGKVYSETVGVEDVAWINSGEGQFARIDKRELRYNENHDPKTGRFTTGSGGGGGSVKSYAKADASSQAKHRRALEKLNGDEYNNGTYDMANYKAVDYDRGYQATFSQIGDSYTAEEYADKVNEFLDVSSDGRTSAGKFDGYPEVSFHIDDLDTAVRLAKKYNQISIWDWSKGDTIETGGTGERKK